MDHQRKDQCNINLGHAANFLWEFEMDEAHDESQDKVAVSGKED